MAGVRPRQPVYEIFSIKRRFQQSKSQSLRFMEPGAGGRQRLQRFRAAQVYNIHKVAPRYWRWWRGIVGNAFWLKRSYSTPGPVSTAMGYYWTGTAIGFRVSRELCSNYLFLIWKSEIWLVFRWKNAHFPTPVYSTPNLKMLPQNFVRRKHWHKTNYPCKVIRITNRWK